jgi:uncharacterized glyoxalase superfamily protein PhnB
MSLRKLTPNLIVDDVNAAVDFYRGTLGFELVASVPESGTYVFALLKSGGVELMLQTGESVVEEVPSMRGRLAGTGAALYIDVDDVRALHTALAGKVGLIKDLSPTFYGTLEFSFTDPNGYIVTYAEDQK